MSPLLRARLALSRKVSPSVASDCPSNSSLPDRPAPAIWGPASNSIHAIGKAVILPAVTSSPGRQRTGCQASRACEGARLVAAAVVEAMPGGAISSASPAPLSNTTLATAVSARVGVHFSGTVPRVVSRQAPGPNAGSSTATLNCLSRPCQAESLSAAGPATRPPSAANCTA